MDVFLYIHGFRAMDVFLLGADFRAICVACHCLLRPVPGAARAQKSKMKTQLILVFHTGSLLGWSDSAFSAQLLAAIPYKCTAEPGTFGDGTWKPIWRDHLVPAFRRCLAGFLQDGQPIADGLKFVVWALTGDHEYFCNVLKLPHWSTHAWCWTCAADRRNPFDGLYFPRGHPCTL